MPWVTASPQHHLVILAQWEQPEMENTFSSQFCSKSGGMGKCCGATRLCGVVFVPPQPSGSEGQTGDELEERERLRRVLKQMGRIKCPSEVCATSFFLCPFLFSFLPFVSTLAFLCPSFPFVQLSYLSCHIFLSPRLPVSMFFLPFPQALLCVSASSYLSLPFPLCLVLDMLPKTTSTLCFPLLTLQCKKQWERAAKNRLYCDMFSHTERWAASSCLSTAKT